MQVIILSTLIESKQAIAYAYRKCQDDVYINESTEVLCRK